MPGGPEKWYFQNMNLFSVTVRNILSYGCEKSIELYVFIIIQQTQGCKRINFHGSISNRKVKPCEASNLARKGILGIFKKELNMEVISLVEVSSTNSETLVCHRESAL